MHQDQEHQEHGGFGTIALAQVPDVTGFGVARIEGEKIVEFVEKPSKENAPSNWINTGAYILEKKTIDLIKGAQHLHFTGKEAVALGIELDLIDAETILYIKGIPHAETVQG